MDTHRWNAVTDKARTLGILYAYAYSNAGEGRIYMYTHQPWTYEGVDSVLQDTMMNSKSFDGDLYRMLCGTLGVNALVALEMCLS